MGTCLKLVAGVGADGVDCPVEAPDAAGVTILCSAEDATLAEADLEADELESRRLHPAMRTPATARAAPVNNVRRAAILVISLNPL
jgi:hypothetical protein